MPVLWLDSGNLSGDKTEKGDIHTEALIRAMNILSYDVVNLAEREMANGIDSLEKTTGLSDFPFISANLVYKDTGEPYVRPYMVLRKGAKSFLNLFSYGGIKVGVIGVTRPNAAIVLRTKEGRDVAAVDPYDALKAYLPELKEKSDIVLLLAFLSRFDLTELLKEIDDVDIVLAGYGSRFTSGPEKVGDTLIFYGGNQGKRIMEVRIFMEQGFNDVDYRVHYLNETYPDDEEILSLQEEAKKMVSKLKREKARSLATSKKP